MEFLVPTLYTGAFSVPTVMVQITLPVRMVQAYNPSTWEAKAQGLITDNNPRPDSAVDSYPAHIR